ncbi:MAG: hypothetical protein A7316_00080 [Candidatus Altiarchaeales archaeon WOR_SM1_86-2]|nr:MAG: hypothetical protein A7316_00080 [Candidatus Altiarchaeales archaeon WOR_SM1_86-2]ODS40859.1 MAG: hypothetical protein A7315_07385 [Candidatus Altiarchaeales archaeon WOR_SM1_79]
MGTITISISDEMEEGISNIMSKFGFESKRDFIEVATRDKILELKKRIFFELSNEIARGLNKSGVEEEEILEEFEKMRE